MFKLMEVEIAEIFRCVASKTNTQTATHSHAVMLESVIIESGLVFAVCLALIIGPFILYEMCLMQIMF